MFANWRHQPKVNNISTILSDTRRNLSPNRYIQTPGKTLPPHPCLALTENKVPATAGSSCLQIQLQTNSPPSKPPLTPYTEQGAMALAWHLDPGRLHLKTPPLLASRPLLTTTSGWESSWFFKAPLKGCFLQ